MFAAYKKTIHKAIMKMFNGKGFSEEYRK